MTAMKPVLDLIIDANILFLLAFCFWKLVQTAVRASWLKHDFPAQLRLLKMALVLTLVSPVLAYLAIVSSQGFWPKTPITVSDIAVAAFLRGDIAIPAVEFEALLNTRGRWMDALVAGQLPWMTVVLALLTAGAFVHLVRSIRAIMNVQETLRRSFVWRRTKRVDIRISDTVFVPFAVRGLFRRHIVLPSNLVTEPRHMRFILAHECQHVRDNDVEWELAFELLRPLMFWNPAFFLWKRAFERLRELSCDQAVIIRRSIPFQEYTDCLLDFCERRVTGPAPRALHVAFFRSGAKCELMDRVMSLQNVAKQRHWASVPVLSLFLMLGVSLAAASIRQPGDWSQDRLLLSSVVNLERFAAINRAPFN